MSNTLLGQVNRDPMAAEMQRMRHQVELLQAELLCIREGSLFEEMQVSFIFLTGSRKFSLLIDLASIFEMMTRF